MFGLDHPRAVLTDEQVGEIRSRRLSGENGQSLAREFGVSDTMIYFIAKGKRRSFAKGGG
jgi:hypothetical protein